jgi:hypothetical protein
MRLRSSVPCHQLIYGARSRSPRSNTWAHIFISFQGHPRLTCDPYIHRLTDEYNSYIGQVYSSVAWPHRQIYGVGQSQCHPTPHIFTDARPKPTNLIYIRRFRVPTKIVELVNEPLFPVVNSITIYI